MAPGRNSALRSMAARSAARDHSHDPAPTCTKVSSLAGCCGAGAALGLGGAGAARCARAAPRAGGDGLRLRMRNSSCCGEHFSTSSWVRMPLAMNASMPS